MELSNSEKAAWLGGFFDGEGHVRFTNTQSGRLHCGRLITFANTDPALIAKSQEFLKDLGIHSTTYTYHRPPNKPITSITVGNADALRLFAEIVPIYSPHKIAKLKQVLDWINRDPDLVWLDRREEMERLWSEGHSCRCIASRLGFKDGGHSRVGRQLRKWGCKINPQGKGQQRCPCKR